MITYMVVALGGALGSVARYGVGEMLPRGGPEEFPLGTLVVNVTGSLAIGFFAVLTAVEGRYPLSAEARAFFMIGVCGGFTTFSAFSLQTMELMRGGHWFYAGSNAVFSFALCLAAVWMGHLMGVWMGIGERGV